MNLDRNGDRRTSASRGHRSSADINSPTLAPGFVPLRLVRRLAGLSNFDAALADPDSARQSSRRLIEGFLPKRPDDVAISKPIAANAGISIVEFIPTIRGSDKDGSLAKSVGGQRAAPVIYVHGGGMIFHDLALFTPVLAELSQRSGRRILGLDYPKAPGTDPQDIVAALTAEIETLCRREMAVDGAVPILSGDSIGGLLCMAVASRRLADARPRLVLAYPVLDITALRHFPSRERYAVDHFLDEGFMTRFRSLARQGLGEFDPLSFGSMNFDALGDIDILSAGCDILADEAAAFAARTYNMADQRVRPVRLVVKPRLPHDFLLFSGRIKEAAEGLESFAALLSGNLPINRPAHPPMS